MIHTLNKRGLSSVELIVSVAIVAALAIFGVSTVLGTDDAPSEKSSRGNASTGDSNSDNSSGSTTRANANNSSDLANAKTMESALKTIASLDAPTSMIDADGDGSISVSEAAACITEQAGIDGAATDPSVDDNQFWINLDTLQVAVGPTAPSGGYTVLFDADGNVGASR